MHGQCFEEVGAFEDVETPGGGSGRKTRFGGFVVFEDDGGVGDGVCFRGEFAGGGVVWLLFLDVFGWFGDGVGGRVFLEGCLLRGERGVGALPSGRRGRVPSWGRGVPSLGMVAGVSAIVSGVVPPSLWWRRARCAVVTFRKFAIVSGASRTAGWRSAGGRTLSVFPSMKIAGTS